ncbi:MAG: alpha/beta fold hydrolase [Patescibacteria group bacterium]|jgi:dipeptidyl aminopeptidase/acylaminoacyl peptidase
MIIILAGVVLIILIAWYISTIIIKQPREVRPQDWKKYKLKPEFLKFPANDGLELSGAFISGSNRATIVLLHGYGHSKTQLLPQACFLNQAGYNVFVFDFRGSGESGGEYITFGEEEQKDLTGAIKYLHTRKDIDHGRIGIFGYSMGGSVALLKGGEFSEVRAYVLDSSYGEFRSLIEMNFKEYLGGVPFFPLGYLVLYMIKVRTGAYFDDIRPLKSLTKLKNTPLLIIHGMQDKRVPVWDAMKMQANARGPAELMLVKGADHYTTYSTAGEEYAKKVLGFFQTNLLEI